MMYKLLNVGLWLLLWSVFLPSQAQTGPPFSVTWLNQVGVSTNGDILTRTATTGSWSAAGAVTSNLLQANTDGWIEFAAVAGHDYIIGLAENNLLNYTEFTHSIQLTQNSNIAVAHEDAAPGITLGSFQTGNIFRISREGNVVKYYKDGIVLRTVAVSPSVELKVKATLLVVGSTTPSITTSFDAQLTVYGTVTGTDGNSSTGSISVSASGGTAPYTYSWSSGEQTNSVENKAHGSYSVTVTDAVGRNLNRTYAVGYRVNWINLIGVSNTDGKLTKTAQDGAWGSGAISSNLLPANTDGWIEFVGVNGGNFRVGLATNNLINYSQFTSSIFIDHQAGGAMVFEGTGSASLGNLQTGDVFRISREGNAVKYYRNGVVLRTVSISPALELKVKVSLSITGSNTPRITSSFDTRLVVYATVTGTTGNSNTGSISVGTSGGASPYSYSWSSGEQTSLIENKPQGSYTVTVTDALGRTLSHTYGIGYSINWLNLTGVSNTDGKLTKTAQDGAWGSGAISANLLPANTDGWIEFVGVNGANFRMGLATNNIINYSQFTNSIFIDHQAGGATVFEGAGSASLGNFQTGDVFRISREGSVVKYYRNGTVLRTISISPALELKIKASLSITGSNAPKINSSFDAQLVVYGTVAGTDGNNNTGRISVSVSGGASPYSYSWSSGDQTNLIENKPQGSYTLTVTDALGRTLNRTYGIGYGVNWINLSGVSNTEGRLTKTAQDAAWSSGAISSNLLPSNTNGWIEFVGINGANFRVGLAVNNLIDYAKFTNSIFVDHNTGTASVYEATASAPLGTLQTGDVFRISREGGLVKYYRNGIVVRTLSVSPWLELKLKASLSVTGSNTPKITASFDSQLVVHGTILGLEGNSGSGAITLSVTGGLSPYTYQWSSGEQTSSIGGKPKGAYSVTVSDALGRTTTRSYNIGYKVNWINEVGVTNNGGRLTKTVNDGQWTSGAISSNLLPANTDGWIEFVGVNGHNFRLGLASNDVINYTQFTNSIYIDHDTGRGDVYEGNVSASLGNFQTGDVFRIAREGGTVKYYRNGVVLRTISVNPTLVLKVKASLWVVGSSTPHVNASFWLSDGIARTYYSIADGDWTTPSIWSLSENGPPSTVYPDDIDKVVIKGHEVTVSSSIKSAGVTITSSNDNTRLKVDGNMAALEVKGGIVMNRETGSSNAEVLLVENNGRLDVK